MHFGCSQYKHFDRTQCRQKGFAPIFILVGILILIAAGGALYYASQKLVYLGDDVKKTPPIVISPETPQPALTPDETANWKEYNLEPFKLNFKYPSDWFVTLSGSAQFPLIRIQNYDPNTAPARGYDPLQDKGKYLLEVTRLPWGNSGVFSLADLENKIPKAGEDANYIGDPAGKLVIKTERKFEINGFPALYREITYTGKPEVLEEATYLLDRSGYAIEVRFGLDETSVKDVMNQILSTFRFD